MLPTSIRAVIVVALLATWADACMKVTPGTPGMPATQCKMCSQDLIMKTTRTAGAKEFATDTTDVTGACAVRTLTCTGLNANIEASYFEPFINEEGGVVSDADDGVTDMVARFTVTCNAAGTAWLNSNIVITRLECASDP
ncbi:hypothetical protein PRIPAC_78344 [Pristionchus pacificus]|uniref:C6 domain-containing protein n=1 Tax=Pristionchus pacificus TaxID=54126 RepID=A0A2A6CMN4_PRIPA|nr:hypothetical protein PRIPAC_78344 [Pristionchus pacificus]|eukprot:PDM79464.1 hypothetical protein PRIPAC_32043 [Pristionchus pacificus]